ncbi:CoA ester lyase [Novosphingobium sp. PC22D]|uniref:HpcH/HpaI aldolase/citrate lyase family protein n=1 Tax=Novosphingobium sp. PC22D TaxID=1962403 RepID=UPI000BF0D8DC|nr:CoA ester lyase [Novosphingobium sp. PC22D]PEQ14516.1 CoA ester lyase [Novosphingobium sp. PC22D]
MRFRSWLLAPGNDETRLASAIGTGADVIVVDLAGTVPADRKGHARHLAAEWLEVHRRSVIEQRRMGRWVRINPLDSGLARDDLGAIMASAPDGIILPRATGPDAVRQLAAEVYELEQRNGILANSTRIIPVVGETPCAAMTIAQYIDTDHQRLAGLTWGANELANAISARRTEDAAGAWSDTFRFVRSQALLTAHACGILSLDAAHQVVEDEAVVARAARDAAADGFSGMFAVHPAQVPAINEAFATNSAQIAEAREIVDAFEAQPGVGALPFHGRVIEGAHLARARGILKTSGAEELRKTPILRPA